MTKNIYQLKLHESTTLSENSHSIIVRVPGGWIYLMAVGQKYRPVFVPWQSQMEFGLLKDESNEKES